MSETEIRVRLARFRAELLESDRLGACIASTNEARRVAIEFGSRHGLDTPVALGVIEEIISTHQHDPEVDKVREDTRAGDEDALKRDWELVGDLVGDGVVVVNAKGAFLYVSPNAERIAGLGATHKPMDQWPDHYGTFRPDGSTPVGLDELPLIRALHGELVRDVPLWLRNPGTPEGVLINASAAPIVGNNGSIVGAVLALRDITADMNFRRMVERSPDAILVHRQGEIVYVNPRLADLLGYESADALLGKYAIETIVHPSDRADVAARMKLSAAGEEVGSKEIRCLRADGTTVYVEGLAQPFNFDGQQTVLVTLRDITERKRMAQQLLSSERMSSLGTLAAGLGHEINNPLAYILTNLDYVGRELDEIMGVSPSARLRDLVGAVRDVRDGAERIRKIVRGLRTMSRSGDELPEPLDVQRVLDVAINLTANEVKHRAMLVRDYGDAPLVHADEAQLVQVFVNLLVNAAHALPTSKAQQNTIKIRTSKVDGQAVIEIHDTGHGIPDKFLQKIFDPFFTTKPPGDGTGLGLSVCHSLVTRWGGEITAESDPPNSTVFRVALPALVGSQGAEAVDLKEPAGEKRGRILIVDDDTMVAKAFQRVLSRQHHVVVAEHGGEAIELLRDDPGFDVIFCDVMMPTMSGEEFFTKLCALRPELASRVIFITGALAGSADRGFLSDRHNRCLEKPISVDTIRAVVEDAIDRH